MNKLRVGVVGVGRGASMMRYCRAAENAQLVAVCDNWEAGLRAQEKEIGDGSIAFYSDYASFLQHDMDAVILANYATEHAPFAIRALERGLHVISELLPCQTMQEAVELIEAVERSGLKYCYLENTCYLAGPREMKRLYREGRLGEFEYGEGEYCHNCEPIWPQLTHGDPLHWRNNMYATFYCTHSLGPIIHITGLRPVSVSGFELPNNARMRAMGRRQGLAGIELVTLENGALVKSLHGELYKHSLWYSVYGSLGRMETAREDAECGDGNRIYINVDRRPGASDDETARYHVSYLPRDRHSAVAKQSGHLGCDFYCLWNAVECVLGNAEADAIDVYEAMDMFLPGLFAHFSLLDGGRPQRIPDLREAAARAAYREDRRCTDRRVAGAMWIAPSAGQAAEIPPEVYAEQRRRWLEHERNLGR